MIPNNKESDWPQKMSKCIHHFKDTSGIDRCLYRQIREEGVRYYPKIEPIDCGTCGAYKEAKKKIPGFRLS
jgi:hypothetical protein